MILFVYCFLSVVVGVVRSDGSIGNGLYEPGIVHPDGPTIDQRLSRPLGGRIRPLPAERTVSSSDSRVPAPVIVTDDEKRDAEIAAVRGLWDLKREVSSEKKEEIEENVRRIRSREKPPPSELPREKTTPVSRDDPPRVKTDSVDEKKDDAILEAEKSNHDANELPKEEKKDEEEIRNEAEAALRETLPLRDWQVFENHVFSPSSTALEP